MRSRNFFLLLDQTMLDTSGPIAIVSFQVELIETAPRRDRPNASVGLFLGGYIKSTFSWISAKINNSPSPPLPSSYIVSVQSVIERRPKVLSHCDTVTYPLDSNFDTLNGSIVIEIVKIKNMSDITNDNHHLCLGINKGLISIANNQSSVFLLE